MDMGSSGMEGGMNMGDMGGCTTSMLWNWNIKDTCPVSKQWHITNDGAFAGTVIGVFFIVVAIEALRRFGREYDRKLVNDYRKSQASAGNTSMAPDADAKGDVGPAPVLVGTGQLRPFRPTLSQQFIRALVYFVQYSATYIVMLIAMTFNGYLLFAIFFGGGFGYLVSSWDTVGLDQAAAGFGAGIMATFTMQPFDIIKVRFQVASTSENAGYGRAIWTALRNVVKKEGPTGLWRGIVPNIIGNSSGWATYFYFYTMFKGAAQTQQHNTALSPSQYLLCASTAGSISAMITNPFYVIKTRMYTSSYNNSSAYRGLLDGFNKVVSSEGVCGLWKGTLLALGTVANSALQFTIYEEMKKSRFAARDTQPGVNDRLPNWEYTALSGSSKLIALAATYPYQVIRSRLQVGLTLISTSMWLTSNKSNKKGVKSSSRDNTPLESGKTTKLLGPGVRDKTGKITEYSVVSRRQMPSMFFRPLSESIATITGPEPCPICGKITRKTAFVAQTFEDLGVEKEVAVRRRVAKAYNLNAEDFSDLRSYNDYLEEVEDITYNLINNIDISNTEAKIRSHQAKNASSIISNSAREVADAEAVKAEEERERKEREARAKEARRELEQEMIEKDQDKEVLLRELEHSSKSAGKVMAQQKSKALKRSSARTTNQLKPVSIPTNTFPPDNPMPFMTDDVWDPLYDEDAYDDYSGLYKLAPSVYADGFKGAESVVGGDEIARAGGWTREQAWERAIREEVIVKSDVMDEGEDADNKHLKNWNRTDHIESFTTNKDDLVETKLCPLRTAKAKQLTIQQSFARQLPKHEKPKDSIRLWIDDKPAIEEVVFKKPTLPNAKSQTKRSDAKNMLQLTNTSPVPNKRRKLNPIWTTFIKTPKIEAVKTAKPFNSSPYKWVKPSDSVVVTADKKMTMFEPTNLKLHKKEVDNAGGTTSAWCNASFIDDNAYTHIFYLCNRLIMPRIEEEVDESKKVEFDDDFDMPLNALGGQGNQGALLEHVDEAQQPAQQPSQPPASTSTSTSAPPPPSSFPGMPGMPGLPSQFMEEERIPLPVIIDSKSKPRMRPIHDEMELDEYKNWITLYPVYFDAKANQSQRKLPRNKCVWWPLANDLAECTGNLGYRTLFEPTKTHPSDWENPGRIKIELEHSGHKEKTRVISEIGEELKDKLRDDTVIQKRTHKLPSAPKNVTLRRPAWSPAKPVGMYPKTANEQPPPEPIKPGTKPDEAPKKEKKPKIKRKVIRA
ncbi:hypothetical protein E3P91_00097 [Wallemia ichthyophaga]|nr:hypothetical protein E3P91_00097 [Wallemia ichthyophaga]